MILERAGRSRALDYDVKAGPLYWLCDLLEDAGICEYRYGEQRTYAVPLGWRDIHYWIEASGRHDVHPGWRRDVMLLSAVYCEMWNASTERLEIQVPYQPEKREE